MAAYTQFSPQSSSLLESSKIAFLQYVAERKQPLHNYQQRSTFWDRQHLYSQNLTLRGKIKEMTENNTRMKTELLKAEKELAILVTKKANSKVMRSFSSQQIGKNRQLQALKCRVDALKEQQHTKHIMVLKKQIMKLKQQIKNYQATNAQLKKSIKHTKFTQLQIQNKQLHEEVLRLGRMAQNLIKNHQELYKSYLKQKQKMAHQVRKQVQARAKAHRQLKKFKTQLEQVNTRQSSQPSDKKLLIQLAFLQQQNSQLKDVLQSSLKNSSDLKASLQQYKNSQYRWNQQNSKTTKLEYSASGLMTQNSNSCHKPNKFTANVGLTTQLNSLELLTLSSNLQNKRSTRIKAPLKFQEKIIQQRRKEKPQDQHPMVSIKQRLKPSNRKRELIKQQDSISPRQNESFEYQYLLQEF